VFFFRKSSKAAGRQSVDHYLLLVFSEYCDFTNSYFFFVTLLQIIIDTDTQKGTQIAPAE